MNKDEGIKSTVKMNRVLLTGEELELEAAIKVRFRLPAQDEHLPHEMEAHIEAAGQALKRELLRQALERADRELIAARRADKQQPGIKCIGRPRYTFKTVFGTVAIQRQRIMYKADGSTEIPAAKAWRTPQQICITRGLKEAVINLITKESVSNTLRQLAQRTGERQLLSRGTIINILHEEGARLAAASEQRAQEIFKKDPPALKQLAKLEINQLAAEYEYDRYCKYQDIAHQGAGDFLPQAEIIGEDGQQQWEQMVIIQADEIAVRAQPQTGRTELLIYNAVVSLGAQIHYFSAPSPKHLFRQVGSLLAVLGVHKGAREICILGDGAQWQRHWFKGLKCAKKSYVLCWYHLAQRTKQLLTAAISGPELQARLLRELLSLLWVGKTIEALQLLAAHQWAVKSARFYPELVRYLTARRPYIRNYAARRQAGLWIASTRVEKFNDWAVATRCKEKGRAWTLAGLVAVAALEAANRNEELGAFWRTGELAPWPDWPQVA